ncbi:primosomal replication protein PriC [Legionella rowbothamii]|uniref:primosomal replication protein PriC n=1 Tax=Legionella rowbothamii TaxID=96229 RepID=UPI001054BEDA|nr:primosomal replication protein PriC [Legionella rowbothamii]
MSIETQQLLKTLTTRLPELEWKVGELGNSFSSHKLPRGLFRTESPTGAACIAEIKMDIQNLSKQEGNSASYLATRIQQKVNVLVALCQIHGRHQKPEEKASFGLKMLSTRQQWMQTLETDIQALEKQQQAMTKALEQMMRGQNAAAILQLKAELGELERRLTLAKETLNRATS